MGGVLKEEVEQEASGSVVVKCARLLRGMGLGGCDWFLSVCGRVRV